ncbi:RfaG Glycosyltransferase [Candidatus Nanopelagicaceae bacterium]
MSKVKVAIVYETVFPEFKGGVERWFQYVSSELETKGFEVTYLNTNEITELRDNVNFVDIGKTRFSFHLTGERTIRGTLSYAIALFKYLLKNDFDFLYMSSFPFLHVLVARLVRILKRKKYQTVVEWFEFPSFEFWNREFGIKKGWVGYLIQEVTARLSDANITYLESTRSQLSRRNAKGKTLLKLPGICPKISSKPEINKDYGSEDLCQIGRLIPDKNPLFSLELVTELIQLGWKGRFTFIGSGPLKEEIQETILKRDLQARVFLIENADDESKNLILQNCIALVHPSSREGYGLVIIEAAAMGVPAILIRGKDNKSTELGISPSLIADKYDVSTLANLVFEAIRNRTRLSQECIRWINEESPKMSAAVSITETANFMRRNREGA